MTLYYGSDFLTSTTFIRRGMVKTYEANPRLKVVRLLLLCFLPGGTLILLLAIGHLG